MPWFEEGAEDQVFLTTEMRGGYGQLCDSKIEQNKQDPKKSIESSDLSR